MPETIEKKEFINRSMFDIVSFFKFSYLLEEHCKIFTDEKISEISFKIVQGKSDEAVWQVYEGSSHYSIFINVLIVPQETLSKNLISSWVGLMVL